MNLKWEGIKQKKKKITPRHIILKLLKTVLNFDKKTHYVEGNKDKENRKLLIRNNASQKIVRAVSLKHKEKNKKRLVTVNLQMYFQ